jgi:hypothetical protein
VLRFEPGREEDAQFWLASLSVNRAIMRALEEDDASECARRRHEGARTGQAKSLTPRREMHP